MVNEVAEIERILETCAIDIAKICVQNGNDLEEDTPFLCRMQEDKEPEQSSPEQPHDGLAALEHLYASSKKR